MGANSRAHARTAQGLRIIRTAFIKSAISVIEPWKAAHFENGSEQGCRIDHGEHHQRHKTQAMVTVHREGRKTEVPLGGSRQIIDERVVQRACEELGLNPAQLPGAKSRV